MLKTLLISSIRVLKPHQAPLPEKDILNSLFGLFRFFPSLSLATSSLHASHSINTYSFPSSSRWPSSYASLPSACPGCTCPVEIPLGSQSVESRALLQLSLTPSVLLPRTGGFFLFWIIVKALLFPKMLVTFYLVIHMNSPDASAVTFWRPANFFGVRSPGNMFYIQ